MQSIKLLDCTLRDGGYVNNWHFGRSVLNDIVRKLLLSKTDVIECGYLSVSSSGNPDVARYSSIDDAHRVLSYTEEGGADFAVMINYGEYPIDLLQAAPPNAPILRVAFHKKDLVPAFDYLKGLQSLGYRFYVQPMGAQNYSDDEFLDLVNSVNSLNAEAFYIVDSFGVMELKDVRRLLFVADNNLKPGIMLGYHAHNNLQQAYSNAKYMVEQNLDHNLIIDASVFGMGRGAGNLNIELFAKYLNDNYGKSYHIEPYLEIFDECLKPIFVENFWGYSLPFYLSSIHSCHPNYAKFFSEKNTLSVKSMNELLGMISDEDKVSFNKDKALKYYQVFQDNWIDDRADIKRLSDSISGRSILILAPGKTISEKRDSIYEFIEQRNPVVIGVGRASEAFNYDYLFISNEKRLIEDKPKNIGRFIKTSNLHNNASHEALVINYSSYLMGNDEVSDNPTLMLLNLLSTLGVREVAIAGFDGFSANPEDNYFSVGLSLGSKLSHKIERNRQITLALKDLKKKITLSFLTPSLYVQ